MNSATEETVSPGTEPAIERADAKAAAAPEPGGTAWWKICASSALGVVVLDHLTKWLTIRHLAPAPGEPLPVIDIVPGLFRLLYAENRGAAFSFLYGHVELLALISVVVSVFMTVWWLKLPKEELWGRLAIAFVLGGAIGNLIDRAFRGFVVDMFDAYIGRHHWPVFNIADSFICIGMGILVLRMWKGKV